MPADGPPRLFGVVAGEGYSSVAISKGWAILFHRIGSELHVDSLDALTGKRRWRFSYSTTYVDRYGYSGGPRCFPVVDVALGQVYALGPQGVLHALAFDTGKKVWRRDLQGEYELDANFFGVGAAPALYGGRLYLNLGGTEIGSGLTLALDAKDGKTAWKTPTGGGSYAAAMLAPVAGVDQLFIFHRGGMSCFDPADGRQKWQFPWVSRTYESVNATTPVIVGDTVLFSATYGTGAVALRVGESSYEVLWQDQLRSRGKILDSHWSTIVPVDGYVYGFAGRHEPRSALRCVELATGKVAWSWESYLGRGALLYSDGHFIALGERGDLSLLKLSPAGHEEVHRVPNVLKWPSWAVPTFAGGLLYLRDEEKLVCFDLRVARPESTPAAE